MRVQGRVVARVSMLAAVALVAAACGGAGKASSPAEIGAAPSPAPTTTAVAGEADPAESTATTRTPSTTTTTTRPPATTTTLVAIDERPRSTAPATEEEPVPVGEVIEVTGTWDIVVTDVDLDAADAVLAYADINPAPEPGFRYVLVMIAGRYLGDRTAQPAFEWSMTDGTEVFEPWIPGCGVVPDSIYDVFDVAPGESFVANVCLPVPATSVDRGLALSLQPQGGEPFYFDLTADR